MPLTTRVASLVWATLGLATAALAQPLATPQDTRTATAASTISQRPDERRGDAALTYSVLGQPVSLGISWEMAQERRLNVDLDAARQRGRDVTDHEVKLDARWRPAANLTAFVQAVALAERRREMRDGSVRKRHSTERGQTWLLFEQLGGTAASLQLGRIALIDRRAWWWDDDLDAIRLTLPMAQGRIETGVARELLKVASVDNGIAPELRGLNRWFGHATRAWGEGQQVEAFWLFQHDGSGAPAPGALFDDGRQDPSDASLRWLGLRATGEKRWASGHRALYRIDGAMLRGRETLTRFDELKSGQWLAGRSSARRVRATAWDLGAQWRWPGAARPTISLGLARGSGGLDGTLDRRFRQTGLQENKARFAGVKRMRMYGELLQPELSNLQVASAGFGLRGLSNSSVEVLWHHYRQVEAAAELAGSRLSSTPTGLDRRLGHEIDLLVALREWQHVELTLTLSAFHPGAAFGLRRDPAYGIEFGLTLTF
jgi:alginate production protein